MRASRAVADTVERGGGRALMNRVGHAFFKARMREERAMFGGEVSGHYYFHDFYCADSGTIPALLILELLSLSGARMSELLEPYRSRYFISGEINSEVADQQAKLEELAERYADGRQYWLDGLSVEYDDWHFNVRPVEHRAAAAAVPRVAALARGHGAPARRGAGSDPFLSSPGPLPRPPRTASRYAADAGHPPPGRSRRRSRSAASTAT